MSPTPPAALTGPRVPSSRGNGIDYMEFRLWIGLHSALQCLILVATDASFIIKYITRFTEEGFSTLISFIFIYDAIKKMIGAFKYYPINSDFKPDYVTMYKCECVAPDPGEFTPGPPGQEPGVGGSWRAGIPWDRWSRMWRSCLGWRDLVLVLLLL